MARQLLKPNDANASISGLKETARVGSSETALRCTAIQFLLAGTARQQVCQALEVTQRALRKWIKAFNQCGIDGLIVKKRPGRTRIFDGQKAQELEQLIENPQRAERAFWTAKAFHGYLSETYEPEYSYRTVVRFFHNQGFAIKVPQPWPDCQYEQQREAFCQKLNNLIQDETICFRMKRSTSGLQTNPALKEIQGLDAYGIVKVAKPE